MCIGSDGMIQNESTKLLLHYPLEILSKVVLILATHPGDARERIAAVRTELALLRHLRLPSECEVQRDRILDELVKRDRNKWGMRKVTASRIATRILSLEFDLRTIYEAEIRR